MRLIDRAVIARTLGFVFAGTLAVGGCSTDNVASGDGAGTTVDAGGTKVDGASSDGATPDASPPQPKCTKGAQCDSGVCNEAAGVCVAPSCTDGVRNAAETDIDCGGECAKCDVLKACKVGVDCTTGVCKDTGTGFKCQAPTNTDGVKNGAETGTDCGGTNNPLCADGQGCATRTDCVHNYCKALVCTAPKADDGVLNGTETDLDCGGPDAKPCADGLVCAVGNDCTSFVCKDLADGKGLRCQAPTYNDGKKNGAETDIDCGGDPAHPCTTGKSCKASADCTTQGCDYNSKCAPARSCTAHYGGDTCGTGGAGGVGAQNWESCCTTLPVTTPSTGTVYLDKYPTTAGRMRVFLESVGYNVRAFVQQARAAGKIPKIPVTASTAATPVVDGVRPVLDPAWDAYLPVSFEGSQDAAEISDCPQGGTCTNVDGRCGPSKTCLANTQQAGIYTSVRNHLGGQIFKNNAQSSTGCFVGSPGTHSFRFPDGMQDGQPPEQSVDVYDTKTLNCVDYLMAQAFCVWDGGRLETFQEWQAAYGPDGTKTPYVATTTQVPVWPTQRCSATACTVATSATDCKTATTALTCNGSVNQCCLPSGDKTYWGCRFPWATDGNHPECGLSWPANTSLEYSNYNYSYEYPKLGGVDYIVHINAPGRTAGRGPLGHSDVIGMGFELTSSVTWNTSPLDGVHRWTGNGSWEGHGYSRTYTGATQLLNKYGKLGLRCAKFTP
jgi:hypothetical protein